MAGWTPITDDEAATLNAARDVLENIQNRTLSTSNDWQAGQLKVAAETADWQVFQVLNHASCYMDEPLDENVLHNLKTEV